ncbi:hypothetical protein D3C87_189820 [compost metagenome]
MRFAFFLSVLTIFCSQGALANQHQCVNDESGYKSPKNYEIIENFRASKDPLILAARNLGKEVKSTECALCTKRANSASDKPAKQLGQLSKYLTPPQIKKECILGSLQRAPGNDGYTCTNGKPKSFENKGPTSACLTEDMANYIHLAVNKAIQCMSPEDAPIDPRFILQKINNESAFNFFIGYGGGNGIGQLTSHPIKAIAGWTAFKNAKPVFIQGEANYLLEDLAANENPACAPFKKIAEADINNPPSLYGKNTNICRWVGAGEGVSRNLIYSLAYYIHIRDNIVKPQLKKRAPSLLKNDEILNNFTLVAYKSPADVKALMDRVRLSDNSKPGKLKEQMLAFNPYLNATNKKMGELIDVMHKKTATANDLRGDSCVTP